MRELVRELVAGGFFEGWDAAPRVVPSAEASGGTAFLQINVGCPHNGCIFCPFFKDVAFSEKPLWRIAEEARFVAAECSRRGLPVRRVMLLDADALCTEQAKLEQVLRLVRAHFPGRRVSSAQVTAYDESSECLYFRRVESRVEPVEVSAFCHTESVLAKGVDGLRRLRELGLGLLWWGVETGSARLLRLMGKTKGGVPGTERERILAAGEMLRGAGIHFVAIILMGLGGERFFEEHLQETLSLLRQLDPPGVSFSDLVVAPGTGYAKLVEAGLLDVLPAERMAEQRRVFEQSDLAAVQYDYELGVDQGNGRESELGGVERAAFSPAVTRHLHVTGKAVR
ncbi:MAG: radical SAM protein [Calditrichaeota bacterium]|nr:radical SAM protein [Calditrichota bacterium]